MVVNSPPLTKMEANQFEVKTNKLAILSISAAVLVFLVAMNDLAIFYFIKPGIPGKQTIRKSIAKFFDGSSRVLLIFYFFSKQPNQHQLKRMCW